MQHDVVAGTKPWGLPLAEKLLPEYLIQAGYTTYHLGKWHLVIIIH
jgi:arylsulfatase A-like enzyme